MELQKSPGDATTDSCGGDLGPLIIPQENIHTVLLRGWRSEKSCTFVKDFYLCGYQGKLQKFPLNAFVLFSFMLAVCPRWLTSESQHFKDLSRWFCLGKR